MLDTIPGPLRDRMEVISLAGYTDGEKLEIARRYLVRRQLEANGLKPEQAAIDEEALRDDHRELHARGRRARAGARDRQGRCATPPCGSPKAAPRRCISAVDDLAAILGAPRFENEVAMRTSVPGVATGLAWTPVGGDILFIEATRVPGSGKLILTGQLGDVMRESAQAALSLVKSKAVRARRRSGAVREERHPHPRPGRRDAEGRAERRRGDVHRARLAADRADGARTTPR